MKGVPGSQPRCDRAGCENPAKSNGICRKHYDRERPHSHRPERVLLSRARGRATAALISEHRDEFQTLMVKYAAEVKAEAERLAAEWAGSAPHDKVHRLRPGPASSDDDVIEDRLRLVQPVQCSRCEAFHERGHTCICQAAPKPTPDRIRALLEDGRGAQWIVDQGYARADVTAVLREINAGNRKAAAL